MFDELWKLYPRKLNKKYAKKTFDRLTLEDQKKALEALPRHLQEWVGKDLQYIPHLSSWLNAERWTDEFEEVNLAKVQFLRSVK